MKSLILAGTLLLSTFTTNAQTLWLRMTSFGAHHEIEVKSDTTSYLVGGNIFLLVENKQKFTYDLENNTDYKVSTLFYNNDPFLDTIAAFNFISLDALLGSKPYTELKIVELGNFYQHLVTLKSGSPIQFRKRFMLTINPFVYSSEYSKNAAFDSLIFEQRYITKINNELIYLPEITLYYTIEGKKINKPLMPGIYIRQRGFYFDKIVVK
jgi:hypothetical protein